MCCSRLAPMRLVPFSYFWTCWNVSPRASATSVWLISSMRRRIRTRLPTCLSIRLRTPFAIYTRQNDRSSNVGRVRWETMRPSRATLDASGLRGCVKGRPRPHGDACYRPEPDMQRNRYGPAPHLPPPYYMQDKTSGQVTFLPGSRTRRAGHYSATRRGNYKWFVLFGRFLPDLAPRERGFSL